MEKPLKNSGPSQAQPPEGEKLNQELIESEWRHKLVSEMTSDYVVVVDAEPSGTFKLRWASENMTRATGRTLSEVGSSELWNNIIHPEDQSRFWNFLKERLLTREPGTFETRSILKNGTPRWISLFARAIERRDGPGVTLVGAVKDITARKAAEQALRDGEERFRNIMNASPMGMHLYELTSDNRLIFSGANPAANRILEVDHDQFLGKTIEDAFPALTATEVPERYRAVARTGEVWRTEQIDYREGAVSGAFEVTAFRTEPNKMAAIFTDITEKLKLLEATGTNQKLESLGVLAGGIAHDFNNLLGGIFGYIELAGMRSKDPQVSEPLSKALSTINRARGLTQQLLTFAKGGAPILKSGHLFPFVSEAALFALSGSSVSLSPDLPADLWPCHFDRSQLGQVIDNLFINAHQAMPLGGTVLLSAQNLTLRENEHPSLTAGRYVRLSVRDTGIGISRDILPRIFDPFFTTKARGHGLGLATCYSILRRHGGAIDAESEPGRGSVFHVYLPACPDAPLSETPAPSAAVKGSGRILIMDDEEFMCDTIAKMTESLGFTPVCRRNGRETLEIFTQETRAGRPFKALILDLTIPGGMGGRELIKEIRRIDRDITAIVVSGYADDPVMSNPADYGFTCSLCKPFMKGELAEILARRTIP